MPSKSSDESIAASGKGVGTQAPAPGSKPEVVEPMIPHATREDADLTPHDKAQKNKVDVVEPMIPHKNRKDME